jgi:hypothetical protein
MQTNAASLGTGCLALESIAANMAAALRGSRCFVSNQWLHTWRQLRLAHGALLESVAACNAALLGTGCLAPESMAAHMAAALLST